MKHCKLKKYDVYVLEISVLGSLTDKSWRTVFFNTVVKASTRRHAFVKAIPELLENVLPHMKNNIKVLAVYVGVVDSVSESANRMTPIRISKKELSETII